MPRIRPARSPLGVHCGPANRAPHAFCVLVPLLLAGCASPPLPAERPVGGATSSRPPGFTRHLGTLTSFQRAILGDLDRQLSAGIRYQDGYFTGGDPPPQLGVCTDVVIRAFRAAGVDLRRRLAADVRSRPQAYAIRRRDPDIDHRRCRNLVVFLARCGRSIALPRDDWQPGDVVFWDTSGDGQVDHVGVVSGRAQGGIAVVHHWPGAPVMEEVGVGRFPITGHFRWIE